MALSLNKVIVPFLITKLFLLPSDGKSSGLEQKNGSEKQNNSVVAEVLNSNDKQPYLEMTLYPYTSEEACPYFEIKESWPSYQLIDVTDTIPHGRNPFGEIIYTGKASFFIKTKVYGRCDDSLVDRFSALLPEEKGKELERIIVNSSSREMYACLEPEAPDAETKKARQELRKECSDRLSNYNESCLALEFKLISRGYKGYLCQSLTGMPKNDETCLNTKSDQSLSIL